MGRIAKPLSALEVGRIKPAGYHAVGTVPGLHLQVADSGARSWVLRIMVGTKRREIGLGAFPAVTLAMAHQKARDTRELAGQGVDPVNQKKALKSALVAEQAKAVTFEAACADYIKAHEAEWRNVKHAAQWRATLATYAYPELGRLLVRDIGLPQVLNVLEPIWKTKTETASRLRGRIESVLDWATTRGYRSGLNPARWKGHLDTVLPAPGKIAKQDHHKAVAVADVGSFMVALRAMEGMGAKALEFAILTAARSGEVRGATWSEIDMDAKLWTVPGHRMKAGIEHRVPLSGGAVKVLQGLPRFAGNDLVFVAQRGGSLSDMTLSAVMRRIGIDAVPHGLRSTFRDWAAERTSYPEAVAEAALAHTKGDKVEAAYFRSDLFEKRRRMMAEWATFLAKVESKSADVLPIQRRAAA
jgi:integrase